MILNYDLLYSQNILFKIIVDFTWRVSDCEELVEFLTGVSAIF